MKRVLMVDDDGAMLFAFRRLSRMGEQTIDIAENVSKARWLLARHHYDMVLADLNLTPQNKHEGLEVIRIAKQRNPSVRAIVWTAYETPELSDEIRKAGAERCLTKPVRYGTIATLMEEAGESAEDSPDQRGSRQKRHVEQ
jgi:DNA-binding NtrC family response regulator